MPSPAKNSQMSGSEQELEVAIVDVEKAVEVSRLATAGICKWRDDGKILLNRTKRLAVQSSKEIPATQDGESANLGTRAAIDFVPGALTVLVPAR